jgi:cell division inhibitor SulA
MIEELIKNETAKLAKEKGFNEIEPCSCGGFPDCICQLSRSSLTDYVYTPTQSLMQKWLRDKRNIHVEITWVDTLSNIYVYHISTTGNAIRPDSIFYYSYEEALEEGLIEALKLI